MSRKQKKRVNVSLDPELYRRAKALGLNMSGVSERALRVYLDQLENGSGQSDAILSSNGTNASGGANGSAKDETANQQETDSHYADASVDEVLADYRGFATSVLDRSENMVDLHTRYIERLLEHADTPPSRITQDDITDYLCSGGSINNATRMNIIGALRGSSVTSSTGTQ